MVKFFNNFSILPTEQFVKGKISWEEKCNILFNHDHSNKIINWIIYFLFEQKNVSLKMSLDRIDRNICIEMLLSGIRDSVCCTL